MAALMLARQKSKQDRDQSKNDGDFVEDIFE